MKENSRELVQFKKANKRLKRVKKFYRHLSVYIIINIILFGVKISLYSELGGQKLADQGFQDWYALNLLITPLLWGLGLLIHGILVFKYPSLTSKDLKPNFIKRWEERKIKEFMQENKDL